MYKKLHLRLTILFTGMSAAILIIMSLSYLYMSEKDLKDNYFLSFRSKINDFTATLEQQDTLSWDWLKKTAARQNFTLAFYDNETPLSYNQLMLSESELEITSEAIDYAMETILPELENGSAYSTAHKEFFWDSKEEGHFYASVLKIRKNVGTLTGIILLSLESYTAQITRQRMRFLFLNIIGIGVLFFVSYFFTGKLLTPVIEARQKQNAFIAAASHELRTPIAVICSAASAAKAANAQKQERFFHIIEQESLRLSTLTDDLLLLNRADSGRLILNMEPIELDTLLLNCYESFEPLVREHKQTLQVLLPKDTIPRCLCDKERICQVLGILISNAVSYGKSGGYIKLELSYSQSVFWITVEDNGIGIADKDKPYIFDRFYRVDESRSGKEHFGLGLCIAKEIIETHGGSINLADNPEGGTRFFLLLKAV